MNGVVNYINRRAVKIQFKCCIYIFVLFYCSYVTQFVVGSESGVNWYVSEGHDQYVDNNKIVACFHTKQTFYIAYKKDFHFWVHCMIGMGIDSCCRCTDVGFVLVVLPCSADVGSLYITRSHSKSSGVTLLLFIKFLRMLW